MSPNIKDDQMQPFPETYLPASIGKAADAEMDEVLAEDFRLRQFGHMPTVRDVNDSMFLGGRRRR